MRNEVLVKHWSDISANPDDSLVLRWRQTRVVDTHSANVATLAEFVGLELADLRALDFGYANHSSMTADIAKASTHSLVVQASAEVVGVDLVKSDSEAFPGVSYVCADLLQGGDPAAAVGEAFDAVFAGAVLEHLSSPIRLMELACKLLSDHEEAKLVITVPNPLWLIGLYDMAYPSPQGSSLNVDHVGLQYAGALAEIAERGGMELCKWCYLGRNDMAPHYAPGRGFRKCGWAAAYSWARYRDLPFAHNLLGAVFRRPLA